MTEYNSDGIPIHRLSKEESEYYEQEEERLNALLRKKKTKRTQPLKDLMRDRTTPEQGLTLYEIFYVVYTDIVKEYGFTKDGTSVNLLLRMDPIYDKYIRRLIKHVRKTDDDFRWLSCVPCKDERGKIKQYKYVNIKARDSDGFDSKLLEEVNAFWHKHVEGSIKGIERVRTRLRFIKEMSKEQFEKGQKIAMAEIDYETQVHTLCYEENMDKIIAELRSEGRLEKLSAKYRPNHIRIRKEVEKELLNKQVMWRDGWLTSEGKPPDDDEVRQSVKDTIATYCNYRRYASSMESLESTKQVQLDVYQQ